MESWVVGFDGDADIERHSGAVEAATPSQSKQQSPLHVRLVSDYICPWFYRGVFRAYWEDVENIGDIDVLCRICAECGLDAAELRAALEGERFATPVQGEIDWGRAVGITGVPTVVFEEKFSVVGAQEYEVFRDIARRIVEGKIK